MPDPVLVVTGGSRGIGAAVAGRATAAGYAVCLTYVSQADRAAATVEELQRSGGQVIAVQADLSDLSSPDTVFAQAEAAFGPVTALVNNAGVTSPIGPLHETSLADVRRLLDVNVLGTIAFTRHAVRQWLERGTSGAVVNISSVAASTGAPSEYVAYAASKAAVEALTVGVAKEVASRSIRVNAVAPGTVFTEIHASAGEPDRPARVVNRVPMGRIGEPDEIAAAVLWLLSDDASYITGVVLRAAGGV